MPRLEPPPSLNEPSLPCNTPLQDLAICLLCVLALLLTLYTTLTLRSCSIESDEFLAGNSNTSVPFFYNPPFDAKEAEPPFLELIRALEGYKRDTDAALSFVLRAHDVAQKTEWMVFPEEGNGLSFQRALNEEEPSLLSSKLRDRIASTAEILESDGLVLERILKPVPFVQGLPAAPSRTYTTTATDVYVAIDSGFFSTDRASSYDSAAHVITHIVRDWSDLGNTLRRSLYDWCTDQLRRYVRQTQTQTQTQTPVLVPGAGLARLAHDIAASGFTVEANELSLTMAVAAHKFLHRNAKGSIHPFAMDFLTNEVDSSTRYQKVSFPDHPPPKIKPKPKPKSQHYKGSLSYTVGDFVQTYATNQNKGRYASVVTCFFIDTATNIYEYILVIRNVLKQGGVWVNVGPLQWHQNAKLQPSADELRSIISRFGFVIKMWKVDETAVNYRHNEMSNNPRFTKFEGYRPLRFVAVLPSRDAVELQNEDALQKIIDIRRFFSPPKQYASNTGANTEYATSNSSLVIEDIS